VIEITFTTQKEDFPSCKKPKVLIFIQEFKTPHSFEYSNFNSKS